MWQTNFNPNLSRAWVAENSPGDGTIIMASVLDRSLKSYPRPQEKMVEESAAGDSGGLHGTRGIGESPPTHFLTERSHK